MAELSLARESLIITTYNSIWRKIATFVEFIKIIRLQMEVIK